MSQKPTGAKYLVAYLQVLWQLLPASVTRVHGDEKANTGVQADSAAISEHKLLLALTNGTQDTVHLQHASALSNIWKTAVQAQQFALQDLYNAHVRLTDMQSFAR